jgi:hypothetical protein
MERPTWNDAASKMAMTLRCLRPARPLGVLMVYHAHEEGLIVWLYDSDTAGAEEPLAFEMALLRQRLKETGVAELGFGLSPDSRAWALVGRANHHPLQTRAGKTFYREMLAEYLGEALHTAWQTAHEPLTHQAEQAAV